MAHAFKTISAKPAFGNTRPLVYQSDLTNHKKIQQLYHESSLPCKKVPQTNNYTDLYLFKSNSTPSCCQNFPVSKSNLVAGQYTVLDLINVCTASKQIKTNPVVPFVCDTPVMMSVDPTTGIWSSGSTAFYQDVSIDSNGELFGNTQCGELNYIEYMNLYSNYYGYLY
jgi:hypothetical protein